MIHSGQASRLERGCGCCWWDGKNLSNYRERLKTRMRDRQSMTIVLLGSVGCKPGAINTRQIGPTCRLSLCLIPQVWEIQFVNLLDGTFSLSEESRLNEVNISQTIDRLMAALYQQKSIFRATKLASV